MLGFRLPAVMVDGDVRLRLARVLDAPFLTAGLGGGVLLQASGLEPPLPLSRLSLWWWMRQRFDLIYCLERGEEKLGLAGIYDLRPGLSAEVALVIFDGRRRRRGYGSRAFRLLAENLKGRSVVRRLFVRVRMDNRAGLSFWRALGFSEAGARDGIINMYVDLV